MAVPLSYSFRNLWTRRLTTVLTASGMALVVFVFAAILMLAEGLQKTLVETGSYDNVVVHPQGLHSPRCRAASSGTRPPSWRPCPKSPLGADGRPLLAKELVVLINLPKRGSDEPSNVIIRGMEENPSRCRPQVQAGRRGGCRGSGPRRSWSGTSLAEALPGRRDRARRSASACGTGGRGHLRRGEHGVQLRDLGGCGPAHAGLPEAGLLLGHLQAAGSVGVRRLKKRIENDPRLTLEAKRETRFYAEQSEMMAKFLRILGVSLTDHLLPGCHHRGHDHHVCAVANRTAEIGTLRALGFQRRSILTAFLMESLFLGLLGGRGGPLFRLLHAAFHHLHHQLPDLLGAGLLALPSPAEIVCQSLVFSLIMGFVGGVLPASGPRVNIVDALRTT